MRWALSKRFKNNSKGRDYSKRDNNLLKTLFSRKSRDKIKEILGTAYYNYGKKGHFAKGYY